MMLNISRHIPLFLLSFLLLFAESSWIVVQAKDTLTKDTSTKDNIKTHFINQHTTHKAKLIITDTLVKLIHPEKTLTIDLDNEMLESKTSTQIIDINFDGIDDVAVRTGVGYGGVNQFYTLWLSTKTSYEQYQKELSNFEVDVVKRLVLAEYKSGPRYYYEIYRLYPDEDNREEHEVSVKKLSIYATYEHYTDDDLCVLNKDDTEQYSTVSCSALINYQQKIPVFALVKAPKAYLFDRQQSPENNGMYLIKNDVVMILNYDALDQRALLLYQGKKSIEKYIDYEQLQILSSSPLKQYEHPHSIDMFDGRVRKRVETQDTLNLQPLTKDISYFDIFTLVHNANMCDFSGVAKRVKNVLTAKQEDDCIIEFHQQDKNVIVKDVGQNCQKLCGHNATIDNIVFKPVSTHKMRLQEALKTHLPKGFSVLSQTFGNLNRDQYLDAVVILRNTKESELEKSSKRPLLIFLGQKDGFKLEKRNDNVVMCERCGGAMGDPFSDVTINRGYFSIEYYGGSNWRWTQVVTFRYSQKDKNWLLHRSGGEYFNAFKPDQSKKHMKTTKDFGRVTFDEFDLMSVKFE